MANIVDYQPFASGVGADVESQAQFLLDLAPGGTLQNGYVTGVAHTNQVNKVARQASMVASAVANFISQQLNISVLDDGNLALLITNLTNAIITAAAPASTGDVKLTLKTAADAGWVLCNDGTIGNALSGATTRANADTAALFALLWNNIPNTWAPVLPGGRGASAAVDFAANKTINLTLMLGRALALSGAGAGLTARALGSVFGEENHQLTNAEMPTHAHGIDDPGHVHGVNDPSHSHTGVIRQGGFGINGNPEVLAAPGSTDAAFTGISLQAAATGITVLATGGGGAHNTMQPTSFLNAMIKL